MPIKDSAKVKTIPPLVPLAFIIISWLIDKYVYPLAIPIPANVQSILAYFFMFDAVILFSFSLYFFFKTKQNPVPQTPTNALYTGGIFRITRNPMYLGFLVAQVVVAIYLNNFYVIISLPVVWWLLNKWAIEPEEVYLEQIFGQKYLDYKQKVRRWL
ncbi:Putative protein-S-isoprenylcysteine methyltransferase [hydrothermal vent metagenome]|uniref:Isoprenylcysteine carboxylmethyltransferase family protein n=1 Tax=hydrothermal vent metagenome TaxID=652676 RepID=A0A3B0W7Z2_9ZZZZ